MKSLWLLSLSLVLSQSSARADWEFFAGMDGDAAAICRSFSFSSGKMDCLMEIQGKFFAHAATRVCEGLSFDSEKLSCLRVSANKRFAASAAQVCGAMSFGSAKIDCLSKIANKEFDRDLVVACNKLSFDSEKLTCLSQNAGAWFASNATQFCSTLSFASGTQSCLRTVANRVYSQGELSFCASMTFDSEKLSCVARTGKPVHVGFPGHPVPPGIPPVVIPVPAPGLPPVVAKPCAALAREITLACRHELSRRDLSTLNSNMDLCEQGESKTGKTTVAAFARNDGNQLFVINKEGQDRCVLKSARMPSGVAYITAVRGSSRSDKIFARLNAGNLIAMDMGHQLNEVLNANRRSYNLSRIETSGMERLELTHRGSPQKSEITFDRMDSFKSEGRFIAMPAPQPHLSF